MKTNRILIIGSGECAAFITEKIRTAGFKPVVAAGDDGSDIVNSQGRPTIEPPELFQNATLRACTGSIGDFQVILSSKGRRHTVNVSHIVVAEEYLHKPDFPDLGLTKCARVLSLSEYGQMNPAVTAHGHSSPGKRKIVFLSGLNRESNPVLLEVIMNQALNIQSLGMDQAYVFTGNLKVAGDGLEKLYRKSKEAGVIFFKFTETMPEIVQTSDNRVRIDFYDEILREHFRFMPDLTIVEDNLLPSPGLKNLSEILDIGMDSTGFLQPDNIHRHTVFTSRRGVLVTGPSRGIQSRKSHETDGENAVLRVLQDHFRKNQGNETFGEINPDLCARCLTCYRLCPHQAVAINNSIQIIPAACEACGLCAAECPAMAIHMVSDKPGIQAGIERINEETGDANTSIAVLACERSGTAAMENALDAGLQIPNRIKFFQVPCAGSISVRHVLMLLKQDISGIMVLTCHPDNCFSEKGNTHARIRMEHVKQRLREMGINGECLKVASIASNMGHLLVQKLETFQKAMSGIKAGK